MPDDERSPYLQPYLEHITWEHRRPKFTGAVKALLEGPTGVNALLTTYTDKFDLDTAVGAQLDVVGEWVGHSRFIVTTLANVYFCWDGVVPDETGGFEDAGRVGWDQGVWWTPYQPATGYAVLDDDHYRVFLKAKIVANHWDGTIPGAYEAWDTLFGPEGYHILIQNGLPQASAEFFWDGEARQGWDKSVWSGYLVKRTNYIRNSAGAGAEVGGTTLPTYWAMYTNWSVRIAEISVVDARDLVHLRFTGYSEFDESYLWFEEYTWVPIHPSDTDDWTFSLWFRQYFPRAEIKRLYIDLVAFDENLVERGIVSTEILPQAIVGTARHSVTFLHEDRHPATTVLRPRLRFVHEGGANLDPDPIDLVLWEPTYKAPDIILQGTVAVAGVDAKDQTVFADTGSAGRFYVEFEIGRCADTSRESIGVGVGDNSVLSKPPTTPSGWWLGQEGSFGWYNDGWIGTGWENIAVPDEYFTLDSDAPQQGFDLGWWDKTPANTVTSPWSSFKTGDTLSLAVNGLLGLIWGRVNGGPWNDDPRADPETGVGGMILPYTVGRLTPGVTLHYAGEQVEGLFASTSWRYKPPVGYISLQADPPLYTGYEIGVSGMQQETGTAPTAWIKTTHGVGIVYEHKTPDARVNGNMHMIYGLIAPYQEPPPPPEYFSWDNFDFFAWDSGYNAVEWEFAYSTVGMVISGTTAVGGLDQVNQSTFTGVGLDYKFYVEIGIYGDSGKQRIGVGDNAVVLQPGSTRDPAGWALGQDTSFGWMADGSVWVNGVQVATWDAYGNGDRPALAIDPATGNAWGRVGSGLWNKDASADPAAGIGGVSLSLLGGTLFVGATLWAASDQATGFFVSDGWTSAAPVGFSPFQSATVEGAQGWEAGIWDASPVGTDSRGWNSGVWDLTPQQPVAPQFDAVTLALYGGGHLDLRPAGVTAEYCIQSLVGTPFFAWDTTEQAERLYEFFSWDETDLQGWDIAVWDGTAPAYAVTDLKCPPVYVAGWEGGAWPDFIMPRHYPTGPLAVAA